MRSNSQPIFVIRQIFVTKGELYMRNNKLGSSGIGGQAVMEGIMMRNKEHYAVAVRQSDGSISVDTQEYKA